MKIFNTIILVVLVGFVSSKTYAQNSSYKFTAIENELSESQKKQIEKATNFILSGDVFMQEVKVLENEIFKERENIKLSNDRKAKKQSEKNVSALEEEGRFKLVNATKTVEKGYDISYEVYKNKILELHKNSDDAELKNNSKKLLYDAKFRFVDAKSIIAKLTDVDKYDYLSKQVKLSKQLKREGVGFLIEALCLYIDCSEPTKELVVENTETENRTPNNNNANNSTSSNYNNRNNNNNSNNYRNNDSNSGNNNSTKPVTRSRSNIYFTVQILAVSQMLPESKVPNHYGGNRYITKTNHNGLWKYLVGRFDTYEDALLFQQGIGRDSFVVALKDGQRIHILDAIEETK